MTGNRMLKHIYSIYIARRTKGATSQNRNSMSVSVGSPNNRLTTYNIRRAKHFKRHNHSFSRSSKGCQPMRIPGRRTSTSSDLCSARPISCKFSSLSLFTSLTVILSWFCSFPLSPRYKSQLPQFHFGNFLQLHNYFH